MKGAAEQLLVGIWAEIKFDQRSEIKLDWIDYLSLSMRLHQSHIGLFQLSMIDSL